MFLLGDFNVDVLSDSSKSFKDLLERQGLTYLTIAQIHSQHNLVHA